MTENFLKSKEKNKKKFTFLSNFNLNENSFLQNKKAFKISIKFN